jgi:hypothetical protein
MKVFGNRVLKRLDVRGGIEDGEDCIMRSFIICTLCQHY